MPPPRGKCGSAPVNGNFLFLKYQEEASQVLLLWQHQRIRKIGACLRNQSNQTQKVRTCICIGKVQISP